VADQNPPEALNGSAAPVSKRGKESEKKNTVETSNGWKGYRYLDGKGHGAQPGGRKKQPRRTSECAIKVKHGFPEPVEKPTQQEKGSGKGTTQGKPGSDRYGKRKGGCEPGGNHCFTKGVGLRARGGKTETEGTADKTKPKKKKGDGSQMGDGGYSEVLHVGTLPGVKNPCEERQGKKHGVAWGASGEGEKLTLPLTNPPK